jgi:transcriptional regulator
MTKHSPPTPDLLQGTLDLLVLNALAAGPLHGWAISKRIQQLSSDVLKVGQGSLYPALYRLEDRGWIVGTESQSPEGRRIKVYRLSAAGRAQLSEEVDAWQVFAGAMRQAIRHARKGFA